jgi:pimeloyl-ACP methyl ester carboxylesterase
VLTTVVATTACVCVSAPPVAASDPVVSRGVTIPAFYTPPAELPAGDGVLVRHEPLRLGLSLPGLDGRPLPGTATRLMYTSTDSNGQRVAVTGAYIEPSAEWKGDGPRPLVVVGSGTMGQGDQCAPSLALQHPLTLNGRTVSFGYENLAVYRLLATGAAVVVTDYVGLGATDRLHTYVNRVDEGHAMLDAARAAHSVPGASVTGASRVAVYGYSQGGGASAAAAELHPLLRARRAARRHLQRGAARRSDRGHEGHRRERPGGRAGVVDQRIRPDGTGAARGRRGERQRHRTRRPGGHRHHLRR